MYLSHFGLNEPPFRITPHTEFFYDGANRGPTLEALLYAVTHDEGIVKVTGEVGSGKTMLCRVLLERLPKSVETIYLANPSLSRDEILRAIAEDLRMDVRGKRTTLLLRALQEHLIGHYAEGHRVVVLIDEAHAMPPETLEEIRLLSNLESNRHKLLQIVLFGQPELDDHLNMPNMRQLRERITHSFRLEPLVRSDIDGYIDFRMRAAGYRGRSAFTTGSLRLIAAASEGLTRRVNILADKSLLAAYADGSHEVSAKHARAAIRDSAFRRVTAARHGWWLGAAGIGAGVAIGFAIPYFMRSPSPALPLPPPVATPVPASPAPSQPSGPSGPSGPSPTSVSAPPPASPASTAAPAPTTSPTKDPSQQSGMTPPHEAPKTDPSSKGEPQLKPAPSDAPDAKFPTLDTGKTAASSRPSTIHAAESAGTSSKGATPALIEIDDAAVQSIAGRLARERYLATLLFLKAPANGRYTIQLLAARESDMAGLENFLRRAAELVNRDDIYVYSWQLNGRRSFRVSYGVYDSIQASRAAIERLPAALRAHRPFPETIATLRAKGDAAASGQAGSSPALQAHRSKVL